MTQHADSDSAESAFYRAFQRCDLEAMSRIWQPSPEITCIHPGGQLLRGSSAILESWGAILREARPPELQYQMLHKRAHHDLAVHTVEEAISTNGSEDTSTRLIATNIYQRSDLGWQMVAHHACLPMMRQPQARRGPIH